MQQLRETWVGPILLSVRPGSGFALRLMTFLGSGWRRLLPPVPVTQCREQKDRRHAGKSASDKENAVGMNEAVRGAQALDRGNGKSLQALSQPGIGRTQESVLRRGASKTGE